MPRAAPERWILHADMDAFYASIEQRDNPELRGKPVIVGANSARGVVAAASYEARKFGVRSAMPGFRARELCPDGVFLPSNMGHYVAVSDQVHEIFLRFTPVIEPLALDEAFLDVSGSLGLFGSPDELARKLKDAVRRETELTVSVGVAPSKLVAKIACTLAKPDGLTVIRQDGVRALLDPLPIRRLWGVGPVLGERLERLGIRTFADLSSYDPAALSRELGDRAAELQALARGEDERPVEANRAPKSYGEENTFEHDVLDRERVTAALTSHAEAVARRIRHDGYVARTVTLKAKLARARGRRVARGPSGGSEPSYPLLTRSKTLDRATDDASVVRAIAVALWEALALDEPVRLLGVSLSNLERSDTTQLDLFASKRPDARATAALSRERSGLGRALDAITERFGENAISRAVERPHKITHGRIKKRGEH